MTTNPTATTNPHDLPLRAITIGKARTVHASPYTEDEKGRPTPTGYPLCGQSQGRHGQGWRLVVHASFNLAKVTCSKCAARI